MLLSMLDVILCMILSMLHVAICFNVLLTSILLYNFDLQTIYGDSEGPFIQSYSHSYTSINIYNLAYFSTQIKREADLSSFICHEYGLGRRTQLLVYLEQVRPCSLIGTWFEHDFRHFQLNLFWLKLSVKIFPILFHEFLTRFFRDLKLSQ